VSRGGCNLCEARRKAVRDGTLKEPVDCMVCHTSYRPKRFRKRDVKPKLKQKAGEHE